MKKRDDLHIYVLPLLAYIDDLIFDVAKMYSTHPQKSSYGRDLLLAITYPYSVIRYKPKAALEEEIWHGLLEIEERINRIKTGIKIGRREEQMGFLLNDLKQKAQPTRPKS